MNFPSVEINSEIMGGTPVLKGTRFPICKIFAELIGGMNLKEISEEYNLDLSQIELLMVEITEYLHFARLNK